MAIKETKNRTEMLKYLADTATANSEADVEEFLKIFNPAPSRKEMGEIFEANLGFDPITHYDIQDVINAAVFLLTDNSSYLTGQSIKLTGGEWMD